MGILILMNWNEPLLTVYGAFKGLGRKHSRYHKHSIGVLLRFCHFDRTEKFT